MKNWWAGKATVYVLGVREIPLFTPLEGETVKIGNLRK